MSIMQPHLFQGNVSKNFNANISISNFKSRFLQPVYSLKCARGKISLKKTLYLIKCITTLLRKSFVNYTNDSISITAPQINLFYQGKKCSYPAPQINLFYLGKKCSYPVSQHYFWYWDGINFYSVFLFILLTRLFSKLNW